MDNLCAVPDCSRNSIRPSRAPNRPPRSCHPRHYAIGNTHFPSSIRPRQGKHRKSTSRILAIMINTVFPRSLIFPGLRPYQLG
jgi:hypothetical protein